MPDESPPDPAIPFPPMEAELVRELPRGRRLAVRAEVGRLPRRARERRRRARALVAQRAAAAALLPRAAAARRAAAAAVGARRRDRDRPRRRARLRRDADAPAPGRVADPQAVGRDPGRVRRLRRAALGRRAGVGAAARGAPRGARARRRAASGSRRARPTLDEARGWLDRFEALGLDGVVAKRLGAAVPAGLARGHGQGEGAQDAPTASSIGVRWKGAQEEIATLLLGLYRDDGELDYVGSCAVAASRRAEVAARVLPLLERRPERALLGAEPLGHGRARAVARCGRSSWSRCATTRCRATASATARSGSAGATTRIRADCTWRELRPPATRTRPASSRSSSRAPEYAELRWPSSRNRRRRREADRVEGSSADSEETCAEAGRSLGVVHEDPPARPQALARHSEQLARASGDHLGALEVPRAAHRLEVAAQAQLREAVAFGRTSQKCAVFSLPTITALG